MPDPRQSAIVAALRELYRDGGGGADPRMQALEDLSDPYGEPDNDEDDVIPNFEGTVQPGPGESWGNIGGEPRYMQREIGEEGLDPGFVALPGGGSARAEDLNAEGMLTHDLLAKMEPGSRKEWEREYGGMRDTGPDLQHYGPDADDEQMRRIFGGGR